MRTRASWSVAAILALFCAGATPLVARAADPVVGSVPLPGGTAGLYRAADLSSPAQPALALPGFIRAAYGRGATPPEAALRYLDLVVRAQAAISALPQHEIRLSRSQPASVIVSVWAAACGLAIRDGTVVAADGADAANRREALKTAGVPLGDWMGRLTAGEAVRVDLPSEDVPLPLSRDLWIATVLGIRDVSQETLVLTILSEPKSACMYYGLMALDDETLAYLASHPRLIAAIAEGNAGLFAEWGRSIRVSGGRMAVPGGDSAASLWAAVIGADPANPEAFIKALLTRGQGRAAFFYDTVAHLDPARQAFALASALSGNRDARERRVRALYDSFARSDTVDSGKGWPVIRHPLNPAAVLRQVDATDAGAMRAPAQRGLWEGVFGGSCGARAMGGEAVDAGWIVERVEREGLEKRGERLASITFAQRVFARATPAELPAVCEAVASFPRNQGLLLTLERMGFDVPADYVRAVRFAADLWSGLDRRASVIRTAHAQGVLTILERGVTARVLTRAQAHTLAMSLIGLSPGSATTGSASPTAAGSMPPGAVAAWMARTLLPELCKGQASLDGCLVRAVSGAGAPAGTPALVSWEDEQYRLDLGAATAARIIRVRQQQKANGFDGVFALLAAATTVADAVAEPSALEQAATTMKALASSLDLDQPDLFGHPLQAMRPVVESGSRTVTTMRDAKARAEVGRALLEVGSVLLADALVSFAHALAIGDPDDAALLGGDPARKHRFDGTAGPALPAWHLPEEVKLPDRSWIVEGSIFALRTVYPRSWVRRLSVEDPGMRPGPETQDLRAFGESAAAFNAFDLTDASRDAVVSAIRRGRARVEELVRTPDQFWKASRGIGVSEWRCRAALWLARHDPARASQLLSLSELMWLGAPDLSPAALNAWGVATRTMDGSLLLRMPRWHAWEDFQGPRGVGVLPTQLADVHLRVAEALADLHLPAVLAPDIAAYAVWDVVTSADMAHPDDWFALSRAAQTLPADRFLDYVSALTAIGPLVPATAK